MNPSVIINLIRLNKAKSAILLFYPMIMIVRKIIAIMYMLIYIDFFLPKKGCSIK